MPAVCFGYPRSGKVTAKDAVPKCHCLTVCPQHCVLSPVPLGPRTICPDISESKGLTLSWASTWTGSRALPPRSAPAPPTKSCSHSVTELSNRETGSWEPAENGPCLQTWGS
ncbi:hypothetical protein SKAU_G00337830 [Synaphobranchus kaupii]|uniref:Uncharacterized protein n=1 Tax=Synaphobranchus kaupii TaxID=118154 RepID=A0A9Q1IIX1_SYNKA|nr:hypothetical protein SKAU_G00337830 [Synaphobranchus kaupii]